MGETINSNQRCDITPCQVSVSDSNKNRVEKNTTGTHRRGILRAGPNSNHLTPTIKNRIGGSRKPIFDALKNSVADRSGSNFAPRKVLKNARGYPYRKARLIDHGGDPTKQWYIVFYAWDIGIEKLVRKRLGKKELNSIPHAGQRKEKAKELIADLNDHLKTGGYLETSPKRDEVPAFDFHGYKLLNAITWVENYKREITKRDEGTCRQYRYLRNTLERFLLHEGIDKSILLRQVNASLLNRFTIYLRSEASLGNKTYNHRITTLKSAFETLRKLDNALWPDRNPAHMLEKLGTVSKKHAAYSMEQLEKIRAIIEPKDKQLLLFIRFLYYTLARPNELRFLKVGDIRMDFNRILISGDTSKTDIEEYVGINPVFAQLIRESGILNYPATDYVFTDQGHPGPVHVGVNYFNKRFRLYIEATGFRELNANYTLYSLKHTGAVQLYLATKDAHLVQQQCRHTTLDQTTTYLRDLGLFSNFDALEKWKGF